ncbi:MAG: adenine phosphoribosyltransferase [Ornithinimicrobium sp.]
MNNEAIGHEHQGRELDTQLARDVAAVLRDIPDFPQPGVTFKDFTPLLADAQLSRRVVADVVGRHHGHADVVAGIEARGFVFGAVVSQQLGVGFVPIRKAGKLPCDTYTVEYELEYGQATLEMHVDAVRPGQRVLVVDDVLATGGTVAATIELIRRAGAQVVGVEVVLEISALQGRARLPGGVAVQALLAH